jgi:hypothetical protein
MNITERAQVFNSFKFVSINIDEVTLKSKLKLSPRSTIILSLLLREYQAHWLEFHTSAYRQHLFVLRKALEKAIGDKCIVSNGRGVYSIPDYIKEIIRDFVQGATKQ